MADRGGGAPSSGPTSRLDDWLTLGFTVVFVLAIPIAMVAGLIAISLAGVFP